MTGEVASASYLECGMQKSPTILLIDQNHLVFASCAAVAQHSLVVCRNVIGEALLNNIISTKTASGCIKRDRLHLACQSCT